MGSKPSNNFQSDRPESGGADKDMQREKSGLLDIDKEKFAQEEVEKRAEAPEQTSEKHKPFSIGSPPNSDPRRK
jgi:hypothetical protein